MIRNERAFYVSIVSPFEDILRNIDQTRMERFWSDVADFCTSLSITSGTSVRPRAYGEIYSGNDSWKDNPDIEPHQDFAIALYTEPTFEDWWSINRYTPMCRWVAGGFDVCLVFSYMDGLVYPDAYGPNGLVMFERLLHVILNDRAGWWAFFMDHGGRWHESDGSLLWQRVAFIQHKNDLSMLIKAIDASAYSKLGRTIVAAAAMEKSLWYDDDGTISLPL